VDRGISVSKCDRGHEQYGTDLRSFPRYKGFVFQFVYELRRFVMPIINLVVALIVVGVLLWLVNNYIPMAGSIKKILNVVVVIAVVLWLLNAFGIIGSLSNIRV
jgi:hypothetical protein